MNSMIQEQTGVSACEILFGQNPNLPSDLSFAPATPVMEDQEGYVIQLKRELGDIRAKLSRILGQERNQEENPFSVGERVVITILPRENRNKLLAKWKGPFTITKIPNRFQIEYLEDGVRRTTHISYAKKFHERSVNIQAKQLRHRLSRGSAVITMASLQLSSGSGKSRRQRKVSSLEEIRRRWKCFSGPIEVKVYGPKEELCQELQEIVEAAGAAEINNVGELWDLCGQRSKEEGGSCDASFVPSDNQNFALSQEEEPQAPAEHVRNVCHNQKMAIPSETSLRFKSLVSYHAKDTYLDSFQTKSETSPELLTLIWKISKKERPRGKHQRQFVFRYGIQTVVEKQQHRSSQFKLFLRRCDAPAEIYKLPTSAGESCKSAEGFPTPVTSPLRSPKPPRTKIKQYAWRNSAKKEVCMYIRILKPLKIRKEEELEPRHIESTNCQKRSDVIVSGVTIASPDSDVTIRERGINKPIAKKRYAQKRSLVLSKGSFKSSLRLFSQTFVLITFILSLIISVGGGLFNVKLHDHKSTVGNSFEPRKFRASSVLYNLREFLATNTNINGELCFCIDKGRILDNNKQLIGYVKILQPTKRDEEAFCSRYLKRSRKRARLNSTTRSHDYSTLYYVTLTQNILAGKCSRTYICPSVDFYAFKVYHFDRYTINLKLCDNFKVLLDLVYLYIFAFYRSWASCNSATFPEDVSAEIYTLVYFSSKAILLMIKSHDKYQSRILIGLAHA